MNRNIFKNDRADAFVLRFVLLVSIISFSAIIQSCNKDDSEGNLYVEYLDLDVYKTASAFTPAELAIIGKAAQRIVKHSVFNGVKCELLDRSTLNRINVSERLYKYIYPGIQVNSATKTSRLKLKSEVRTSYNPLTQITTSIFTFDHGEFCSFMQSARDAVGTAGYITPLILSAFGSVGSVLSGITGLTTYLEGMKWSNQYDAYINRDVENYKGAIVTSTSQMINGVLVTTNQFSFR